MTQELRNVEKRTNKAVRKMDEATSRLTQELERLRADLADGKADTPTTDEKTSEP
jgi:hypothetical protein